MKCFIIFEESGIKRDNWHSYLFLFPVLVLNYLTAFLYSFKNFKNILFNIYYYDQRYNLDKFKKLLLLNRLLTEKTWDKKAHL